MSLRDTWVQAKAASKIDFKKACTAKKEALAKKAQGGNPAAQAKWVEKALGEMGLDDSEEPAKFFKLEERFRAFAGPKQLDSFAKVLAVRAKITPKALTSDPKLAARRRRDEGHAVRRKDPDHVRHRHGSRRGQGQSGDDEEDAGPPCNAQHHRAHDPSTRAFHEAMLAAIAATEEYTGLIQGRPRVSRRQPDFRKPLIDAFNSIEKTIGDLIKAGERHRLEDRIQCSSCRD